MTTTTLRVLVLVLVALVAGCEGEEACPTPVADPFAAGAELEADILDTCVCEGARLVALECLLDAGLGEVPAAACVPLCGDRDLCVGASR